MIGQTLLITGGSGTFGTAFVRYALDHGARRVIVLSRGEHRQAALEQFIADARLECWLKDVSDRHDMMWAMRAKPDVVIHAAACKRVEKCEANPAFAHKVNVEGTRHVVEEAMLADIPRVLVISSDKATSPETTYGKTKAAAEEIALGQNAYRGAGRTRISVVRYGNVIGSQGSFLDTLWRCRETGASVPITDPAATRFWWSIDAAVAFVASVLTSMQGTEIWVPRIPSARLTALAAATAPQSAQHLIGMRGAEKLHEAMISPTEAAYTWELPDRFVLLPKHGQWWSPSPPAGAVKVQPAFTYTSNDSPLPVSLEVRETLCASP